MSSFYRAFVVGCLWLSLIGAKAEVLFSEAFDYPDGSLTSVGAALWNHHSGSVTGQVQVVSDQVRLSEEDSEDVSAELAATAPVLYAAFNVCFTSMPGGGEQYFWHFKNTGTSGYRAKVFATTSGATSGSFRVGITEGANSGATYLTNDLELLTIYRVVVRHEVDSAASTLWIDPSAASDPSIVATDTTTPGSPPLALALRQSGGIGRMEIDQMMVATSFEEVINASTPPPAPTVPAFSLLDYNAHGNSVEDWSTNSAQVRAIGRQVQYLDPDIITFQEIPRTNAWQMANFVAAFRPGFYLATSPGTDGYIVSAILSRFPITRSQSWLDGIDLKPFGYTNANPYLDNFTRDLFEAEVAVPGFPWPLHVFTVHLKSGQAADASSRRAAEAGAISNFLATSFLPANDQHPFVLTGDLNEDIARPPASQPQTLQTLTSTPTGLRLTTPRNPSNNSELTISIRSGLYARYDYILPGGLLFSNIVSSQVFRSDLLPSPPPPLLGTDSETASDHLPVFMVFSNPFDAPFQLLSLALENGMAGVMWESTPGRVYDLESSFDLNAWGLVASNLVAEDTTLTQVLTVDGGTQFYRVVRH